MKRSFSLYLATLGPIGYLPAPGTMGTLATLPLIYALAHYQVSQPIYVLITFFLFVIAIQVSTIASVELGKRDPAVVIIDELVGTLVTFYAIPITYKTLIVGFVLFRFFDIAKLFGVRQLEHLRGGLGIVLDDVWAGVLSSVVLRIIIMYVL